MLRLVSFAMLWCACFTLGPAVAAACTKDTDCKADRICEDGRCLASAPAKTPVASGPRSGQDDVNALGEAPFRRFALLASGGLAGRDAGSAGGFIPSFGVTGEIHISRVRLLVEFLVPWQLGGIVAGIGLGVGTSIPLSGQLRLVLDGMLTKYESTIDETQVSCKGSVVSTDSIEWWKDDRFVLSAALRYGDRFVADIGPRIGFGDLVTRCEPALGVSRPLERSTAPNGGIHARLGFRF